MTNFRPWAAFRRFYYGTGALTIVSCIGVLVYFTNYYVPPGCFDGKQNAGERGIDCGGACVRICSIDVTPPVIRWADSFEIEPGQYNAVAYIENQNAVAATRQLRYTFELTNNGVVVASRSGTTILPPNSTYPVFEGRIFTDSRQAVTDTSIRLDAVEVWQPAALGREQFRTTDLVLKDTDTSPRLDAVIENRELTGVGEVEVVATIFNSLGEPLTASQTFIDQLRGRSSETVVFTWPNSIAKTVRSCEVPSDVIMAIDLSGSMNNDGDTPPQPLTDAVTAAAAFVEQLRQTDLVGVVTFATDAELVTPLSGASTQVADTIRNLVIDPASETGFTNTMDGIRRATEELSSARHNKDARRVVVLLTDGLPTAPDIDDVSSEAITAAAALRATGADIYAIGLGAGVNASFITALVDEPSKAFIAPSGEDLARIYQEISTDLCEVGPTRIDIIPKTSTNFTPLR